MKRKMPILLLLVVILVSVVGCGGTPDVTTPSQTTTPDAITTPSEPSATTTPPTVDVPTPTRPTATATPETPVTSQSGNYPVVDTGQTTFYNNSSAIFEPQPGDAFYGQDARYDGNQPSYTVSADGLTVLDNVTGLTWTQGADWNGDGTLDVNDKFSYTDAQTYVDTLNAQQYGGYSDWRLPTIKELYSLIDYNGTDPNPTASTAAGLTPFIDTDVFQFAYGDVGAGERIIDSQWATTTLYGGWVMNNSQAMFGVNFADGRIKGYPAYDGPGGNSKTYYVCYCRGNPDYGVNDFVDNGDGTVSDYATGLMWAQADSGQGMNWEDALAWVQQKNEENYLGYSDWRLPDAKELQSLVDYTQAPDTTNSAALDPLFEATQITNEAGQADYPWYWSGTTFIRFGGSGSAAVYVTFGRGLGSMDGQNVIDVHGAGCQRSDPKTGDESDYPSWGHGPQGDVQRVFNYVRLVRTEASVADQAYNGSGTSGAAHQDGLTLFAPISGRPTYLIDLDGVTVHQWQLAGNPGQAVNLLPGGDLLATYRVNSASFGRDAGGIGGGIELLDWDGNHLWSYQLSDDTYSLHHDVEYLPDGSVLALAWEKIPAAEALAAGMDAAYVNAHGEVWYEAVFEIDPTTDAVVWEWYAWDHLLSAGDSAADHPELIDPTYPAVNQSADWLHINAIDYNSALDHIMLSVHNTSEIWIIDHAVDTATAAGTAGDLLYRWGNPAAYGESGAPTFYSQHDAAWVDPDAADSTVTVFNNGNPRLRPYSDVLELELYPYVFGQATVVWEYGAAGGAISFFADHISGAQRLANGNTLICEGVAGYFFEVTPDGAKVWEYTSPYGVTRPDGSSGRDIFRAERYGDDYIPEGVVIG